MTSCLESPFRSPPSFGLGSCPLGSAVTVMVGEPPQPSFFSSRKSNETSFVALMSGAPVWSRDVLEDSVPVPEDMRRRIVAAGNRAVLAVPMRAKRSSTLAPWARP